MDILLEWASAHDALFSLAVLMASTGVLWLYSVAAKNVTVIDTFWGLGFVLQAFVHTLVPSNLYAEDQWKPLFIASLVAIWGFRLSFYLHMRNHSGPEDVRYANIRKSFGESFWWQSLFVVFWLQALLNWIIGQSIRSAIVYAVSSSTFSLFELVAFSVYFIGMFFEVIGDFELYIFKRNPKNKGKLLTTGLRQFTRHPNYFGNATIFWAFYFYSVCAGDLTTVYSPILMTYLLLKVSGVPLLSRGLKKSKPGWEEYVASTSTFFPWFPNKKASS